MTTIYYYTNPAAAKWMYEMHDVRLLRTTSLQQIDDLAVAASYEYSRDINNKVCDVFYVLPAGKPLNITQPLPFFKPEKATHYDRAN